MVVDRLRSFDPQVSVSRVRPLDTVVAGVVSHPRFNMLLVVGFALLALVLAAVGIYGIAGYLVARRTREIGIRLALGAQDAHVLRLVMRDGLRPALLGILAGSLGALALARAIRALLFGIAPLDPASFAIAALVLLLTAVAAALLPARRATRVDPMLVLRSE